MISQSFTKQRLNVARPEGPLPGDLLLFTHAKGFTRLVPWYTGYRYYHVAIYEGGPYVLEARPSGVVRRDIVNEPDNVFRIIPMPTEKAGVVLDYTRSCLGSYYDVLTVAALVVWHSFPGLTIHYEDDCRFTCTELVIDAWKCAGIDLFPNWPPQVVVPGDFARFLPIDSHDQVLRWPISK